ncbi:baculovirus RING-like protein [Dasychira pudibunda nucleopolyhedrovirus]|nr:baculovirus RING-like protein [Dasychira pudibunda nucleopolyhedrovirus]WHM28405.1 bRING [Dasychira pudibunda nucleopolyhedrovirus]
MLLTVYLKDKQYYLFKLFREIWPSCTTECRICLETLGAEGGVVGVPDSGLLNLDKMFHAECIERWKRGRNRDPFNRAIKYYFAFPPPTLHECKALLEHTRGFIGDDEMDRVYSLVHQRVTTEDALDVELNFARFFKDDARAVGGGQ